MSINVVSVTLSLDVPQNFTGPEQDGTLVGIRSTVVYRDVYASCELHSEIAFVPVFCVAGRETHSRQYKVLHAPFSGVRQITSITQ